MAAAKKISELDARGIAGNNDLIAVVAGASGATKKASVREVLGGHGMFFLNATEQITSAVAGVFEKVTGASTGVCLQDFTQGSSTLTYTGARKRGFQILSETTFFGNTGLPGDDLDFRIAVNGVTIPNSESMVDSLVAGDNDSVTCFTCIELDTGDTVEVWFSNSNTSQIDFTQNKIIAKAL